MLLSTRTELKRCLFDLREDILEDMDFERALRQTLRPVMGDSRLRIRFRVARSSMDDSLAHAVLSIVRELVSNAVRHGRATSVTVAGTLEHSIDTPCGGNRIVFSVRDDGIGFDPAACVGPSEGHFGLTGIRDRIDRADGEFILKSDKTGTYAHIALPL